MGARRAARASSCMRPAAPRTATGPRSPGDDRVRPVLGARATRPASPSSCTPATAATRRNGYARDGFAAELRAAAAGSRRSRRSTSSAPRTTSSSRSCSTSSSSASRTCASRRSRTAPSSCADLFKKLRSTGHKMPGLLHRGPGRDVPAQRLDQPVLGGRRQRGRRAHGRRPRDLRLRLAAHRGHAASRSTTRPSSRRSTTPRSAASCATTRASSTHAGRPESRSP